MARTIGAMFFQSAARYGAVKAVLAPHGEPSAELTYGQLADKVRSLAAGLITLGLRKGDRVALFSDNRPRWIQSDLAMMSIGVVDVPRGSDSAVSELDYILRHSECSAAFVQDLKLFQSIRPAIASASNVRTVVMMDDSSASCEALPGVAIQDFETVERLGRSGTIGVDIPLGDVKPGDLATIVYTSGTTGVPKGVMLSHINMTHQSDTIELEGDTAPGDILLVMLPSWHAYERAVEYVAIRNGWTLAYSDKRNFREDMQRVRPHLIPCVPRVWEMIYDVINDKLRKEAPGKQRLVRTFIALSHAYIRMVRLAEGRDLRRKPAAVVSRVAARAAAGLLSPVHRLADRMVYSRIRNATGGRMKAAVSGGGSLAPYIDDFFEAMGLLILNGYGLTETAPVIALRTCAHNVRGSVGRPIPDTEVSVRDEEGRVLRQGETGVVWARGPQLMLGYNKDPEATAAIMDAAGWLNTGDLGWVAATGDLVISGRAKDTIVLSSGENVEPEHVETVARRSALVTSIVVVGQDHKNVAALVVPCWPALAAALGLPPEATPEQIIANPRAARVVREDIAAMMHKDGGFSPHEFVHRVALLDTEFSDQDGTLTQTMKVRRRVVMEKYAAQIAALY